MKPLQTQLYFGRQAAVNAIQAAIEPSDKFVGVGVQGIALRLFLGSYAQEIFWIENVPQDVLQGKTNQVSIPKIFTDALASWADEKQGHEVRFFKTGNGTVAFRNSAIGAMTITTERINVVNPFFKAQADKAVKEPSAQKAVKAEKIEKSK